MQPSGFVFFPGAGSSADHPVFLALEKALAPTPVARRDFPYRRLGRSFPDKTPVLVKCVRDEVRAFAEQIGVQTSSLVIGGRSMGGRMCSMAAADEEDPLLVQGLVLISYPLYAPAKPEAPRTEHLHRLNVPILCISGTKDNFGTPAEIEKAMGQTRSVVTFSFIQNGRHELKGADDEVVNHVQKWVYS